MRINEFQLVLKIILEHVFKRLGGFKNLSLVDFSASGEGIWISFFIKWGQTKLLGVSVSVCTSPVTIENQLEKCDSTLRKVYYQVLTHFEVLLSDAEKWSIN